MSDRPSVAVAVPVVTAAPALEACLTALASCSPVVIAGGFDEQAAARLAERVRAVLPEAGVLREPLPGRAQARNRALAHGAADVIAYVDPDVVVDAGWWPALQAAWATGPPDLGCAGGPVGVEFRAGRPGWLGDGLLPAFGPLDYGDRPLDLDALERTLMGGNVSFRATALRGIGGFWPARGRDDQLDWFSEEHHAQRELARVGWRTRYEPAMSGARVADVSAGPRGLLRSRRAYGARLALVGSGRPAGIAVRETARGAVGATVALATGRRAVALERAARAAENAGVLTARRVAEADLEPVAAATPFRHSVPTARARPRRAAQARGPLVLLYHRVAAPGSDPLGLCVTPAHFAEQVQVLRERTVVPLREIGPGAPADAVAITFDDGYADNLAAFRALAAAALPATLFVSTGHVEDNRWFWWDEVDVAQRGAAPAEGAILELGASADRRAWAARTPEQRAVARAHLHAWLASLRPPEIEAAMARLRQWAHVPGGAPPDDYRPLTVAELMELARLPGVEIGAHTRRHARLAGLDEAEAAEEAARSRDDVASWTGEAPRSFSYPFGVPGVDFTPATSAVVAGAGFDLAVSNRPGRVTADTDRLCLPRVVAPDCDGERFARWLREAA